MSDATENEGWERAMGREGIGTVNENGLREAEMCALNNLDICRTLFKHLNIHKLKLESPNGTCRERNQIDHVMVNGRYRRSVCDAMVMRVADVNSDHNQVITKVNTKLCRNTKPSAKIRKMYDVSRLKDNKVCRGFKLEIRNRFQQLSGDENDISKNWTKVKKIRNETTEKILDLRTRKHKDRLNTETYKAVDERGKLKEEIGRSN